MSTITFRAIGTRNVFRDGDRLRRWLRAVVRDHGHAINELNYVLLDDEGLLEFNRRYLGHDDYTDVITFDGQNGVGVSGDILMSADRIRENASVFGVPVRLELRRVMVHGLLHLLGHRDKTVGQRNAMRQAEDLYLKKY